VSPQYEPKFPAGSTVRVAPRERLERFQRTWRYHHPISKEQISYAGTSTSVSEVYYYHGGDVLYRLGGVPGMWHEECVDPPTGSA
jgi:hypothetical protein